MRGFILTLMDIHYSLDGSEYGTTLILEIQDIGIYTLYRKYMVKMDYCEST